MVPWAGLTAEFAWRRIAPGPRAPREVAAMTVTSALIPPLALGHWARGLVATAPLRRARRRAAARPLRAVLLDRDATLVVDVPYNGDPAKVEPMPGAREALDRLRAAGLRLGIVSNQSGIARGLLTREQADAVNARVAELLGPFDAVELCPHGPQDGCACRKPQPGMVLAAARRLGVDPAHCAVVGDIGADVGAAAAAGARGVLVPTAITRDEEVDAAPVVCRTLGHAVDALLAGRVA
jgi:histidinol-phosphate phosphatase family protein